MTNNTLNGALEALGELMAENLEAKNVQADASDGLTTLANKILTIPPFISGLDISTALDLSISNVINRIHDTIPISTKLSCYFDDLSDEDVDLTGLLQGATVDYYNGHNYIGSAITNTDGIATLMYVPNALGQFNIKAKFEGTENYSWSISNSITIQILNKIIITADKNIIQKNEDVTLTITIPDVDNAVIANQMIRLYAEGNHMTKTLIGNAETDENGIATFTYTGTGAGDVTLIAESDNFLQETYELLDLVFYDVASSTNVNNYTANSGESITYDSTEQAYKITKTDYGELSSVTLNNNRFSNTVSIKADIKMTGSSPNHQVGIGLLNDNVGVDGKFIYYPPDNYYAVSFVESTRTSYGGNEVSQLTSSNIQKNVWYTLIVEINGNNQTLQLYDGDTLVGTVSANKSVLSADNNEFAIWNGFNQNSTTFIKNIQVKAL